MQLLVSRTLRRRFRLPHPGLRRAPPIGIVGLRNPASREPVRVRGDQVFGERSSATTGNHDVVRRRVPERRLLPGRERPLRQPQHGRRCCNRCGCYSAYTVRNSQLSFSDYARVLCSSVCCRCDRFISYRCNLFIYFVDLHDWFYYCLYDHALLVYYSD